MHSTLCTRYEWRMNWICVCGSRSLLEMLLHDTYKRKLLRIQWNWNGRQQIGNDNHMFEIVKRHYWDIPVWKICFLLQSYSAFSFNFFAGIQYFWLTVASFTGILLFETIDSNQSNPHGWCTKKKALLFHIRPLILSLKEILKMAKKNALQPLLKTKIIDQFKHLNNSICISIWLNF